MSVELTITLNDDDARMVRERIATGEYRSVDDVMSAGLLALMEQSLHPVDLDDDLLRKLIEEADGDDPASDMTGEQFRAHLRQHIDVLVARRDGKA